MMDDAITAAYEAFAPSIRRYVRSRGLSAEDAEDICSLVFIEAWQHFDAYVERGYLRAWLYRIAHSRIVDYCRRYERRPQVSLDVVIDLAGDDLESRVSERDWLAGLLLHPTIPASQQRALYYRYIRDYTSEEMYQVGVAQTPAGAKAMQRRGIGHMRALVGNGW